MQDPKIILWLAVVGVVVSTYPLFAYSRDELLPSSTSPSLISSVLYQLNRSGGSPGLANSSLRQSLQIWFQEDPLLILFGLGSLLSCLVLAFKNQLTLIPPLLGLPMIFYFLRGGVVFEFYLIPLIPIVSLSLAIFVDQLIQTWPVTRHLPTLVFLINLFSLYYFGSRMRGGFSLFTSNQTQSQIEAVNWFLSQTRPNAFLAIDQSLYLDLVTKNQNNFQHVYYYWKIEPDPALITNLLANNPQNVTFLAVTPQMENDIKNANMTFLSSALATARPVNHFENDGWRVTIYSNLPP